MLTQIHPAQEDTHQIDLQRLDYLYTRIAHHCYPRTAEVGHATRRVEHETAVNAAASRRHQRLGDLISHPSGVPDIEHHLNIVPGKLDIADQRLHHIIRGGQELQLVTLHAADTLATLAELKKRGGHLAVLFGKDMLAGFKIVEPLRGGGPHGARALCSPLAKMQLTKREIGDDPYQRQDIDDQ